MRTLQEGGEPKLVIASQDNGVALNHSPSRGFSPNTQPSDAASVDWLIAKVRDLEQKLAHNISKCSVGDGNLERLEHGTPVRSTGVVSKTRYFGRSHWSNLIQLLAVELSLLKRSELEKDELYQVLANLKSLAREIKGNRVQSLSSTDLGRHIPARDVTDLLVDHYVRNFEGTFRILHIPTFRCHYEKYRQDPSSVSEGFIIQLQLLI
ncbi:fungal specific transcription factor domain-containing protein [Aspergillus tanneri]|uniref:Uncharacterized protein n=1 Tax=Aspergillus tanneri TaxID=1220188 RepID=A0A5M9N1L7_9EURO|nr:uncharacterized protein ATNIH1004_003736 [Aspergillus tanneri]KAA8651043.1 hypothetical protein ATNIH1004_003736 [Aspergillus tanneri]